MKKLNFKKCICIFGLIFLKSNYAHAYIDPVSGSIVVQAVVGVVCALIVALKLYYKKLKSWFSPKKDGDDAANSNRRDEHDHKSS